MGAAGISAPGQQGPGEPVCENSRLLSFNYGLLWGIVASSGLESQVTFNQLWATLGRGGLLFWGDLAFHIVAFCSVRRWLFLKIFGLEVVCSAGLGLGLNEGLGGKRVTHFLA